MYAVQLTSFGPASSLALTELPDLSPGPGQALISAAASGVHLMDVSVREGEQMGPLPLPDLPFVLGREIAGVVRAVGAGVDPTWTGRRVAAHLGQANGGYATEAVTDVGALLAVPEGAALDEALAMAGTGRTAVAIAEAAALGSDDVALVLAAAGGLGALLVQEAKAVGATVIGAAGGPDKVALVRDLGADQAIDYTEAAWADALGTEATVVLEGVGGALARAAIATMADGGRLVTYGWASGEGHGLDGTLERRGISTPQVLGPAMAARPGGLRRLQEQAMARLGSGQWRPLVTRFPLSAAATAHEALVTRGTTGKVVLVPPS